MTIEEELTLLESHLRRLKIEYEIYFSNPQKKPHSRRRLPPSARRIAFRAGCPRRGTRTQAQGLRGSRSPGFVRRRLVRSEIGTRQGRKTLHRAQRCEKESRRKRLRLTRKL